MRHRLNKRGKIAVTLLVTIGIVIFLSSFGGQEDAAKVEDATSLETLSDSFEPIDSFANSELSHSIIEKEREQKEKVKKEKAVKQNKKAQKEHAIYLTFDDGPSKHTHKLLDILNDYHMQATFFMLGPNMKEHSEVVKRMKNKGFGLALHGMTHDTQQVYHDASSPSEEMIESQKILKSITGFSSNMVRLPYGSVPYLTQNMRFLLDQKEFHVWDWDVDSRDWEFQDERYVTHTIEEIEQMEDAGVPPVVLLHDQKETIKHLPELLDYIQKQGFKTKVLNNDMAPVTFQCDGRCQPTR